MRRIFILLLLAVTISSLIGRFSTASTATKRFIQDRFAIGLAVDPPIDDYANIYYQDIADANFTVVVGGFGARTPEAVKKQIELCEMYNLKAIVWRAGLPSAKLPESLAVWGYVVHDEPNATDFPKLRKIVKEIQTVRSGRVSFINLFPNYASEKQLGTRTYNEYVKRFIDEVGVDVLCMDHYPVMKPDMDTRQLYLDNLETMRKYSLEQSIPHWNFFNVMPFGDHFDPTEAQIRWQIYTSLAYGSKGVFYFCYWTPKGDEFPKGGGIITAEGRKTRHYEQVKRINYEIKQLGTTLMALTSTGVYRITYDQNPNDVLKDTPVKSLTKGDYLVGVFKHIDGRWAILLNNYSYAYTAWPTVEFCVDIGRIREVCKKTGKEVLFIDDSPAMNGLQISLDSGEGRLFLLQP
ncbi:MAG: hypothetical protein AB1547_08025 [Thermodesulfobacteriota bacterium]